jgi:hypothetical protein
VILLDAILFHKFGEETLDEADLFLFVLLCRRIVCSRKCGKDLVGEEAAVLGIIVGNELGAGNLERGKAYGIKLKNISYVIGLCSMALVLALTPGVVRMVILTDQAREYLTGMMVIMAVYMIGRCVNTVTINGVLDGGGDTVFDMYSLAVSMWGIAIPLAFAGAFVFPAAFALPPFVFAGAFVSSAPSGAPVSSDAAGTFVSSDAADAFASSDAADAFASSAPVSFALSSRASIFSMISSFFMAETPRMPRAFASSLRSPA